MMLSALLPALFLFGFHFSGIGPAIFFPIVAAGGIAGGAMNVAGRRPLVLGALVGLVTAMGGFAAVYFWTSGRESVNKLVIALAVVLGALPGMVLQYLIRRHLAKKSSGGGSPSV